MADTPIYAEIWEKQYLKLIFRAIRSGRVDFLRANKDYLENETTVSTFGEESSKSAESDVEDDDLALVDSGFSAGRYFMAVNNKQLDAALERLNDEQRNVAIMAFGFGLSNRNISDETGIAVHTVKRLRRKALQQLQKFIGEE